MAKAGLLEGKRATIHWENQDSFAEEFESVELTKSVFIIEGNRMTTAGGTSSIDLMLKLIANDHGEDLANAVADQQIYSSIRTTQDIQRLSVPTRLGVRHRHVFCQSRRADRLFYVPLHHLDDLTKLGMSYP